MARKKRLREQAIKSFPNVLDYPPDIKGKWNSSYFNNENPLIVELACGEGFYTNELARRYPQQNFVGVDLNGERIWRGARIALAEKLSNVAYLKILIQDITEFFAEDEVSAIWITFPDPFPKRRHSKHRLTSSRFLALYKQIVKKGGSFHLKTDDTDLFEFTLQTLNKEHYQIEKSTADLYAAEISDDLLKIQTKYERKFLTMGRKIKYICFSF